MKTAVSRSPGMLSGGIFFRVVLFLTFLQFPLSAQPSGEKGISPGEFHSRRVRVLEALDSSSALVMKAGEVRVRSNDVNYRYRQESNFLYLTGIDKPNCYLLILPRGTAIDSVRSNIILFVPPQDIPQWERQERETILASDRFHDVFSRSLAAMTTLYVSAPDLGFTFDWLNNSPLFTERDSRKRFQEAHEGLKVKSAGGLLAQFRSIKSEPEIGLIKRAIMVTGQGIDRAMKISKPGVWEYELQAEIEYAMTRNGAEYTGFPSIIGSGENSLILHYDENRRQTTAGDVVVMDVGAEVEGYSADITRTIPVSGRFTPAQREVYSVVLQAQKETIAIIKPGVTFRQLDEKARDVITRSGYGEFIRHGVSHPVGLDVHDVAADMTLKAGMVITVEPGIYIGKGAESVKPEYRGFGVRIEDDVLVTETGCILLSKDIPNEVEEIERIMRK